MAPRGWQVEGGAYLAGASPSATQPRQAKPPCRRSHDDRRLNRTTMAHAHEVRREPGHTSHANMAVPLGLRGHERAAENNFPKYSTSVAGHLFVCNEMPPPRHDAAELELSRRHSQNNQGARPRPAQHERQCQPCEGPTANQVTTLKGCGGFDRTTSKA